MLPQAKPPDPTGQAIVPQASDPTRQARGCQLVAKNLFNFTIRFKLIGYV